MFDTLILANSAFQAAFSAIVFLSVAGLLGVAIGWFIRKPKQVINNDDDRLATLEKENTSLLKKLGQQEKHNDSLKKEKVRWEDKYNAKSTDYEALLVEFKEAKVQMDVKLSDYNAMEKRKDQIEQKYFNFKKEYDVVKRELPNERNEKNSWKNKAERKEKELGDFRNKILAEQNKNAKLQASLKELEDIQTKLDNLKLDYKVQSRKVKKLISDCKYWEDQHFKTHHDLTEQKESYEKLLDLNQELHLHENRMKEEKRQHLSMIEEYKNKFITLHDSIHKNQ